MSKSLRAAAAIGRASLALAFVVANARAAATVDVPCHPLADLPDHEAFVALNRDQWQFARALFLSAPTTPLVLPPGDGAMLRRTPEGSAEMVFIDGDDACAPSIIPKVVVETLDEIARGVITHPPGRM